MRIGTESTAARLILNAPRIPAASINGQREVMRLIDVSLSHAGRPSIAPTSLTVRGGELVLVTGAAGSGKSSLLEILALRQTQWQGEYLLCGRPVRQLSWRERRQLASVHIGAKLEGESLIEGLTLGENLEIPLAAAGCPPTERREAIEEVLHELGIEGLRDCGCEELQGTERLLSGIARAVVSRPTAILLDEPLRGLGARQQASVIDTLQRLRAGGSLIVVASYDVHCDLDPDRVAEMRRGSLSWLRPVR